MNAIMIGEDLIINLDQIAGVVFNKLNVEIHLEHGAKFIGAFGNVTDKQAFIDTLLDQV